MAGIRRTDNESAGAEPLSPLLYTICSRFAICSSYWLGYCPVLTPSVLIESAGALICGTGLFSSQVAVCIKRSCVVPDGGQATMPEPCNRGVTRPSGDL